jgi:hypothetical protein
MTAFCADPLHGAANPTELTETVAQATVRYVKATKARMANLQERGKGVVKRVPGVTRGGQL